MAKRKKPPSWLNNRFLIYLFQSKIGVVACNWLAQSMLYAERVEVMFRIILGCVIFLILLLILRLFVPINTCSCLLVAFIAHTVTFFINGHFYVTGRYWGIVNNEPQRFIEYPEFIRNRLEKRKSICSVVFFGSISRERFSPSSDLDCRVISEDGFINNFISCLWTFIERFIALINRYPLDIYVVTKYKGLEKLAKNEMPVILFDKNRFIDKKYDKSYQYDIYKGLFEKKYVRQENV